MKKIKKAFLILLSLSVIFLSSCSNDNNNSKSENKTEKEEKTVSSSLEIEKERTKVCFEVENYGNMVFEMYPEYAPESVSHFLELVESEYYNGCEFICAVPGKYIESSNLTSLSSGECTESVTGEFSKNGYSNDLKLSKGTIAFDYLKDEYDSATSKLKIFLSEDMGYDGYYAGFAKIIEGEDILNSISKAPINEDYTFVLPIVMKKVYIV